MKMFIKRFWGFDPVYWPIVSFSQKGSLDALLAQSQPGDTIVFVGTQGPETKEQEQGKLLGFAEFGRGRLHSRQALPPDSFASAEKGPSGDIKWPYAVLITRAWRFTSNPLPSLTAVLGRQLSMAATSNALPLSTAEQEQILTLPRVEIDVAETEAIRNERERIAAAVGPGGTMGPIPASFTTRVLRDADREATTYAFQFGSYNVWKIGWAHDAKQRLEDLNKHVPHEVLGARWGGGWIQKWASAAQAYAMEQRVLRSFASDKLYGERVHCTKEALEASWRRALKDN
jgi:hypothetical protein